MQQDLHDVVGNWSARRGGDGPGAEMLLKKKDDRENHRGRSRDGRGDKNGFCRRLKGITGRVVGLELVLARLEVGLETKVPLDLLFDAGDRLGLGQFENRLSVVRDRAV